MWKYRIDNMDCYPMLWMEHQRRDAFWKHGSVCENYGKIEIPVLNVSGWVDGYTAAVFRSCREPAGAAKGIAGPWGHKYPHVGVPGPAIGFLQECKRWWDRWLKGKKTGVENDPPLRVLAAGWRKAEAAFRCAQGPLDRPAAMAEQEHQDREALSRRSQAARSENAQGKPRSICSRFTTGLASGEWCAYGLGKIAPELALDQREDDAQSLCFDGAALKKPISIVGRSHVRLRVAADKPQAQVAVRLNAIHPDGTVERITYGLLNLVASRQPREAHAAQARPVSTT